MEFDSMEDFSTSNFIKGHRTKRSRPPSSPVSGEGIALIPSFTSMSSDDDDRSDETTESTIEDEIMANCLMYLAQSGGGGGGGCLSVRQKEVVSEDSTTKMMKGGLFVYTCKTCNKNFPSFQALGGHRASHKRHKNMVQEDKKPIFTTSAQNLESLDDDDVQEEQGGINISPEFITNKTKIHECSFCGSEFSSGQALGGHMRRHRNSSSNASKVIGVETEKPVRVFQFDLNLPAAPEDDHHHHQQQRDMNMKLQFNKEASAASALVDCHY